MLPAAALKSMRGALDIMKTVIETGEPVDRPDLLVGIEDIMELMGYGEARALEARLLTTQAYEDKYKRGAAETASWSR
jgi:hypothetical protein